MHNDEHAVWSIEDGNIRVSMGAIEDLAELDETILSARRILGVITEVYVANPTDLSVDWIRDAHVAVDDLLDALGYAEEAILDRRVARERRERNEEREKSKARRPRTPVAASNPDLSRDPRTIAGAVRSALADAPDGLLLGELVEAVRKLRSEDTDQPSISSALSAMVKRREIAREGFHRHYRYRLIVAQPTKNDEPTEDPV